MGMGVGGVCTPQQIAAKQAAMPIARPQVDTNSQSVQSVPNPILVKPAGSMDIRA